MADTDAQTESQPQSDKKFKAVTFWLAGPAPLYPNPRIRVPGDRYPIHFRHGTVTVVSQAEYDAVKRALGNEAYEEDMPKSRKVKPCPTCGYAPRSTEAREAHEDCHPPIG